MRKLKNALLISFMALFGACNTTGTNTSLAFSDGYSPKFAVGDCIQISDLSLNTDGTILSVVYIDFWEDVYGNGAYILRMIHKKIGHPTYHALTAKAVDKIHKKVDCPKRGTI